MPASQLGDLAAMAASLPGVQLIPGADGTNGFSVLGLTADQNATTLNGMNFGGSNLPRDATCRRRSSRRRTTSRAATSAAGSSTCAPGGLELHHSLEQPERRRAADAVDRRGARALGQQYTNLSLGGAFTGPILLDKAFYNILVPARPPANDLQSLLNTDPLGLQALGVSTDSVNRLLSTLSRWNVPTTVGASDQPVSTIRRWCSAASTSRRRRPTTGQAFNLTFNGSWNRQAPSGCSTTELPSHSGERSNWNVGLFGRHTSYFGFGMLTRDVDRRQPDRDYGVAVLDLPNGSVRVNSTFADGTASVQNIAFGGNPAMNIEHRRTTSAQFMNQLSWFSENNKHRLKLTTRAASRQYSQDQTTNQLGTFIFNSLADLEPGRPAMFTRQLSPRKRSEGGTSAALSLGDSYRPNGRPADPVRPAPRRQPLQRGAGVQLRRRAAVRRAERRRAERLYLSPRIGFSWTYGTAPQVGGVRRRGARSARRRARRHRRLPEHAERAGDRHGDRQHRLAEWRAAAHVRRRGGADARLGGVHGEPRRDSDAVRRRRGGHRVREQRAERHAVRQELPGAARAALEPQVGGPMLDNRFRANVDVTYSLNMNQAGNYDLNFNPATQFTLGNEGDGRCTCSATSIVPTTGAIAARDARVCRLFSRVSELRSDLRSETQAARVTCRRGRSARLHVGRRTCTREQPRAVPRLLEHGRQSARPRVGPLGVRLAPPDPVQLRLQLLRLRARELVRQFRSGKPFTPIVRGDMNGDGYSNDRAFIFDPAATTDPALANGMRGAARQRLGLGARVSCSAARHARASATAARVRGRRARTWPSRSIR